MLIGSSLWEPTAPVLKADEGKCLAETSGDCDGSYFCQGTVLRSGNYGARVYEKHGLLP